MAISFGEDQSRALTVPEKGWKSLSPGETHEWNISSMLRIRAALEAGMLKSLLGAARNPEGSGRPGDTAVLPRGRPSTSMEFLLPCRPYPLMAET